MQDTIPGERSLGPHNNRLRSLPCINFLFCSCFFQFFCRFISHIQTTPSDGVTVDPLVSGASVYMPVQSHAQTQLTGTWLTAVKRKTDSLNSDMWLLLRTRQCIVSSLILVPADASLH